jgi:uncharacterized membrane protein YdjX (TVP38/TMEM64 family)
VTLSYNGRQAPLAWLKTAGRALLLLLLAGGAVAAWLHRDAFDPSLLTATIARYPAAPLVFLAAHIVASLLFIPRTMLGLVAGLVFGLWWGLVWAALGSVAGAIAGFLIARYINGGLIDLESIPRLGPILLRAEDGGWRAVTMLRLIPILPHSLTNYALGLTRLSLRDYALGSLLGQLPMTIAYVSFGAAGERMVSGGKSWLAPVAVGAAALALSILLPRWHARRAR